MYLKLRSKSRLERARWTGLYSPDYFEARARFIAASERLSLRRYSSPIEATSPTQETLTIDVAVAGDAHPKSTLVVSSGVHGVEGFFGSAVQLAFLEGLARNWQPPSESALVMIHVLNPFGFAWQRRFNEENVDLNRNFLLPDEEYAGAPPLCSIFRRALMRDRSHVRWQPASSRMALLALRHGVRSFWETLPVGQYEFPDWLFFGGRSRSQTARALEDLLPAMFDRCEEVVHLDLHTGLGRWASGKLLLSEHGRSERVDWWTNHFGARDVVAVNESPAHYQIRGGFGSWLQSRFPESRYRFATAEFGTYSPMRVVQALAEELHWHGKLGTQSPNHPARGRLTEVFVPRNDTWRSTTLRTGLSFVSRASESLWREAAPLDRLRAMP